MKHSIKRLMAYAPENIRKQFLFRDYPMNSLIFPTAEAGEYLFIIENGTVEVLKESYKGTSISINIFHEEDVLGEIEIFCPEFQSYEARAKTKCRFVVVPKALMFEWMKEDYLFSQFICETLAYRLYTTSDSLAMTAMLPLKQQVLSILRAQYLSGDLNKYTKEMLIKQIKAPLRSINRVLQECRHEGIIEYRNKRFSVLNKAKLNDYVLENDI